MLQRFTTSNLWILPITSLRTGREQHVPDSSNHSQNLMKLFNSSSPEGNFGECATSAHTHHTHHHTQTRTTTTHSNTPHHTTPTHATSHGDRVREREREGKIQEKRQDNTSQDKRRQDKREERREKRERHIQIHLQMRFYTEKTRRPHVPFNDNHYPSHLCFSLLCPSRNFLDNSVINSREDHKRSN